jgi:hypothetical protein
MATPSAGGFHVHVQTLSRVGVGVITSVRTDRTDTPVRPRMSDIEYLSLVTGIPVRELLKRK